MTAKQKQGMAALEEFLQQKYVELYEDIKDDDNKVLSLINNPSTSGFFYKPEIGALQYIVDSEGHALYLINKSGLPEEIKSGLVGGEAGNKTYSDYASLSDVYGVTTNLKVYYCSNGLDSLYGLAKDDLDNDNPLRVVFPSGSPLADIITEGSGEEVTAEDLKSVKDLKIDGSQISSLKDLYNLTSLQSIRISNYNGSLSGLENAIQLSEIFIENSEISDYSPIGMLGNKLNKLYFYNTKDIEIEKLCSKTETGIAKYDLPNLQYFGIMGYNLIDDIAFAYSGITAGINSEKSENRISDVLDLNNFSDITKKAIKYLYLNNNDLESLSGLEDFVNVYGLRIEYNSLKTLQWLKNMVGSNGKSGLTYLIACNNNLGESETYNVELESSGKNGDTDSLSYISNCKNLYYINVDSNNIKWTEYINNLSSLKEFHIGSNMNICDVPSIKAKIFACSNYTIDPKYSLDLIDEQNTTKLDLMNYTLTFSNLESIKKCSKLSELRLDGIKLKDNSEREITDETEFNSRINDFLSHLSQMQYLSLNNINLLNSISFISNMTNIKELGLLNTKVTDLTLLNSKVSLYTLGINNENINLENIQDTISRLGSNSFSKKWFGMTNGLYIPNLNLLRKIESCTKVTRIWFMWHDNAFGDGTSINLSGCSSLESIRVCRFLYKVKLPKSLKYVIGWAYTSYLPDFSNCSELLSVADLSIDNLMFDITQDDVKKMVNSMKNCKKLTFLDFYRVGGFTDLTVFEPLKGIENFIKLRIGGYDYYKNQLIASLNGIENLTYLEELIIEYCNVLTDFSKLSELNHLKKVSISYVPNFTTIPSLMNSSESLSEISITNCKINDISKIAGLNLTALNLSNNNITSLKAIENIMSLVSLTLVNNTLYDTFSYLDEGNIQKTGNNVDILVNLNQNGALRTLKLSGNNGITEFSKLQGLPWNEKDF